MRYAALCLIGLQLWLAGCDRPADELTELEVTPKIIDLGKVDEGVNVTSSFTVRNPKHSTIAVEGIKGGCSCITGGTFPITVGPLATVTVPFYVNTAGKNEGSFSAKLIAIVSAGGRPLHFPLELRAMVHVSKTLQCSPNSLFINCQEKAADGERQVRCKLVDVVPGTIDDVACEAPEWLAVKCSELDADEYVLCVEPRPRSLTGLMYGEVTLKSRTERFKRVQIPVTVRYVGELACLPASIVGVGGKPAAAKITASSNAHKLRLKTIELQGDADSIKHEVRHSVDGLILEFSTLEAKRISKGTAELSIECDSQVHHVRIPFLFTP